MTKMPPETVFAAFEQTALRWPERDFLTVMPDTAEVYGIPAGTISYYTAYQESLSRAEAFDAAGYRRGMRVAVLLENRPDYFLIWLALNRLGVSVVPINPDLRQSEQT
jgi:acyl-CoA synthetase (AMP-forming)/AMP-acid ligase II